jgi:hypothetical protein
MASGLILVDIQNEYFPGGRMELAGIQQASANAGELLALFRDRGWPTFHVQHLSQQADAPLFTPGTPFVEIHESVKPLAGERVIQKHFPNSFHQTPLLEALKARGGRMRRWPASVPCTPSRRTRGRGTSPATSSPPTGTSTPPRSSPRSPTGWRPNVPRCCRSP